MKPIYTLNFEHFQGLSTLKTETSILDIIDCALLTKYLVQLRLNVSMSVRTNSNGDQKKINLCYEAVCTAVMIFKKSNIQWFVTLNV